MLLYNKPNNNAQTINKNEYTTPNEDKQGDPDDAISVGAGVSTP